MSTPFSQPTNLPATPTLNPNPGQASTITLTSLSIYTSVTVSTAPNGDVFTTTLSSTLIVAPSIIIPIPTSGGGGGGSNNKGVIIGGIAGGVSTVVIALIFGLFYWCRPRRRETFDGPLDPNRGAQRTGRTDLTPGTEATPYFYEPEGAHATSGHPGPVSPTWSGDSSMRQYRDSQALLGGNIGATTPSHYAPTSSGGTSAYPASSHEHSSSSQSGAGYERPYRPMSTKGGDARRQRGQIGGLGLASAPEEANEGIMQHSDGGVVPVAVPPPLDVPPSYDSIPGNTKG